MSNKTVEGATERLISQRADADMIKAVSRGKLLTEPEWMDVLHHFLEQVKGFDSNGLPRYGSLSILASKTTFFVYDNPGLIQLCDTAFATETMVGFNKDFLAELVDDEVADRKAGNQKMSVVPLILHELEHIMRGHHGRMLWCPPVIANIAQDAIINSGLARFLGNDGIGLGNVFNNAIGVTPTEYEFFNGMSEERAGQYYLAAATEMSKQNQQNGQQGQQPGQPGQQQPGQQGQQPGQQGQQPGQQGQQELGQQQSGQKGQPGGEGPQSSSDGASSDPSQSCGNGTLTRDAKGLPQRDMGDVTLSSVADALANGTVDSHDINNEKLAQALDDNGLTKQRENLNLPAPGDSDAFNDMAESQRIKNQECVTESMNLATEYSRLTGRSAPGGHIDSAHGDAINKGKAPTIDWKTDLQESSEQTDGLESKYTDDYLGDTAILLGEHGMEVHVGDEFSFKAEKSWCLALLDTSGSMPLRLKEDFLGTVSGMLAEPFEEHGFEGIILGSADTTSRGDFLMISADEKHLVEKVMTMGGGGTDFINPIHEGVALARDKEIDIASIVYLTDMGASIPTAKDLPEDCPPVIFVTTEVCASGLSNQERKTIDEIGKLIEISGKDLALYQEEVNISDLQDKVQQNRSSGMGR